MIHEAARLTRMAAATSLFAVAIRFTTWEAQQPSTEESASERREVNRGAGQQGDPAMGSYSPVDLEKLKELGATDLSQAGAELEPQPAGPTLHRLYVDLGPSRSQVIVNGLKVGQTPYGGQVSCSAGDVIEVVVLPKAGAPLRRSLQCSHDILSVRDKASEPAPSHTAGVQPQAPPRQRSD